MDWRKLPRPYRKKGENALSTEMKICLTESDYQEIGRISSENNLSISAFARNCILEKIGKTKRNLSLSWEELRKLKGKPIWIEDLSFGNSWQVIKSFHSEVMTTTEFGRYSKSEKNVTWQAYRKERNVD